MSEIKLIDKTFRELEIDGSSYFAISRKVYDAIEQLQQENKELKDKIKVKNDGFMASIDETCEYATILDKFEKWLKEKMNFYKNNFQGYSYERYREILDKLQELKEGKK